MDEIDVLAIGSEVSFGEHNSKKAKVNAISIKKGGIAYEVVYWDGEDRIRRWIPADELTHAGTKQSMRVNLHLS